MADTFSKREQLKNVDYGLATVVVMLATALYRQHWRIQLHSSKFSAEILYIVCSISGTVTLACHHHTFAVP
jgi:intracellular septation protein A